MRHTLRVLGWSILLVLALVVVAYSLFVLTSGLFPAPLRESFAIHRVAITAHIAGGVVALAITPFQLVPRLRRGRPSVHRWLGRTAMVAILAGGLGGLFMATVAYGGVVSRLGFAGLALAWLTTASLGLRAIRAHKMALHRRWMIRTIALTVAAVTLRLWLPLLLAGAQLPFDTAYPIVAWLCWVPNLLVAEVVVRRTPLNPSTIGAAPGG